ncbi:endo alpha-1,4 polygalactosaminidase [Microbacterium enclense]|uniref:Uncharacterized protein n=1 Tax=Microbacterium enclense TaxID=993073 RepID=A0A1G6HMR1_9MICO|nr:endo alpha-1,4 polygalactosaminidase [Microbacterium enclense]SDB95408.1 hypothetical protein SAMN05216418_1345 [Microbacterium enclense]
MSTSIYPRVIHALSTFTLPDENLNSAWASSGTLLHRGQTVTVTANHYEATKDRFGESWLDYSEEEQEARWGEVRFRDGAAPDDVNAWDNDPGLARLLRETALKDARGLQNTAERADAVAAVFRKYGRGQTSQSLGYVPEHR